MEMRRERGVQTFENSVFTSTFAGIDPPSSLPFLPRDMQTHFLNSHGIESSMLPKVLYFYHRFRCKLHST